MNTSFRFLTHLTQSPEGKLWDEGDAGPSAIPTAAPAPAQSAPAAPVAATPPTAAPVATPQAPEGYVPSYRIRETREAAMREANEQFAAREAEYQGRLNQIQSQLHALVGVQPPPNPEVHAVKSQFSQLFPNLARLEERGVDVLDLLERAGDLESQNKHYWQSYAYQTMDRLYDHASKALGGPLNEEAKGQLHSAFTGFVQSSPELTARYASDPTLIEDFWRAFTSSFIDPVRRSATATVAGRASGAPPIPQDTPSGAPRATPAPQPNNLDERAAAAWALYQSTAKP